MDTVIERTRPRTLLSPTLVSVGLALAATIAGLSAAITPAEATPRSGGYVAALASPLAEPRQEILSGLLWKCAGERCSAPAEGSRPLLVCGRVVKKFGPVARFSSPQGELSQEELARCNAAH